MIGLCLGLAFSLIQAQLPISEFTLAWNHSVEKVDWEEDYRITGAGLVIVSARIRGSGAGMEPPADAILRDGWWHYRPVLGVLAKLTLTRSPYTAGYRLCWSNRCISLAQLLGLPQSGQTIDLFPCPINF